MEDLSWNLGDILQGAQDITETSVSVAQGVRTVQQTFGGETTQQNVPGSVPPIGGGNTEVKAGTTGLFTGVTNLFTTYPALKWIAGIAGVAVVFLVARKLLK